MGVAGTVVLESSLVVFLAGIGQGDGKDFRAGIRAIDGGISFLANPLGAGVDDGEFCRGGALESGIGKADNFALRVELLGGETGDVGVFADVNIGCRDDGGGGFIDRDKAFDDADFRSVFGFNHDAGKEEAFTGNEVDDFDGEVAAAFDVEAVVGLGSMKGGQLRRPEAGGGAEGFIDEGDAIASAGDEDAVLEDEAVEAIELSWKFTGCAFAHQLEAGEVGFFPGTEAPVFFGADGPVEGFKCFEGGRSESCGHEISFQVVKSCEDQRGLWGGRQPFLQCVNQRVR